MNATIVGQPITRVDGNAKVTGSASYAADFGAPRLAHAVLVQSTCAKGSVASIDDRAAAAAPGVLLIMTHKNAPRLPAAATGSNPPGERALSLLQDAAVRYNGEPVAVVVAETLEQARAAALLLQIGVTRETPALDFDSARGSAYKPEKITHGDTDAAWGDVDAGLRAAQVRHEAEYATPMECHNPMEPHATLAMWDGERLTVHDSTQGVSGARKALAKRLGVAADKIRVICPYVGGGFGCKGSAWSHVVLAAMAAREVRRPVRLVLERTQMFGPVGHRPPTRQRLTLGADAQGKLTALRHEVVSSTSTFEDWTETSAVLTRTLYACPNGATTHRLVKLNLGTPTFQRAPGESTGSFALECAMDELAWKLKLDPLELRLRNHADAEPLSGKPFSSKALRECYRRAAERFGWSKRSPAPRSMRDGDKLIGYGMATATYPANRQPSNALVRLSADGRALVQCGTQDLGTGTYTIIAQVAADALGVALERITVEIGDSELPEAPVSGGSMTAASVTPAVRNAAQKVREQIVALAVADSASPLHGADAAQIVTHDGWLELGSDATKREPLAAVLARAGGNPIEARADAKLDDATKNKFATHSFGAVFAEVELDEALAQLRVRRIVACYDVGRVLNAKTARSQLQGGIVWGIGMALHEQVLVDAESGRVLNANLAQYHVPVNADVPDIDVSFIDQPDERFNELGARGIGEIGITAVPAAIANALYHASGKRIRELPLTPERLLQSSA